MTVEAVIFDWGGTLSEFVSVELADVWRLAAQHLAPHHAGTEDEIVEQLFAVEERFWARTATDQHSATLADLVAEASRQLGIDVAEAVLEEAALRHLDAWTPHIRHDPEARAALASLRALGLRIGLLSNTHWPRVFHEHFLERDGLAELIDVRLYTSEMARMKPHPRAFKEALDAVDVHDASRAVFVGDRPFDDIFGAKRAGLRAVLRPNDAVPPYDVQPDATIASLHELVDLVARW